MIKSLNISVRISTHLDINVLADAWRVPVHQKPREQWPIEMVPLAVPTSVFPGRASSKQTNVFTRRAAIECNNELSNRMSVFVVLSRLARLEILNDER